MAHAKVLQKNWSHAFKTACFLINQLSSPMIKNKSPLESLFQVKPDYMFLRTFGFACWSNLRPYNSHKLDFRSHMCAFLGYSSSNKGYQCLHIPSGRVYISRHVIFDKGRFPFLELSFNSAQTSNLAHSN